MSTYITTSPRNILQPLAFQGLLVCEQYTQLIERIRAHLGDQHSAIFAEPMFDEMQDRIDWYTTYSGLIRPFNELSTQEQDQARVSLTQIGEAIAAFAKKLTDMPENTNQIAGHIVTLALKIPDENYIYLVGDQPVLVAWGFTSANPNEHPQDIGRLRLETAPKMPIVTPAASEDLSVPVERPSRAWPLWWLWWLLPVFFLLLLWLLFFFRGPIGAFFAPSIDAALQSLTEERDSARNELIKLAEGCEKEGLVIPDNVPLNNMAFLEGLWRCDTGLINTRTGKAVIVDYNFDAQGQGTITIESDRGLCTAKAMAKMQDADTLAILTEDTIVCPEGTPFVGQAIQCGRDGKGVRCQGKNQKSSSLWNAEFYRMSKVEQ